jgi:hypothetical protein
VPDDLSRLALLVARGRSAIGLALAVAPGLTSPLWLGSSTPLARALVRMIGVREIALGLGTVNELREGTNGPGWLSWGAVADAVDAIVCLTTPGFPRRARLVGLGAAASGVGHLLLARRLADRSESTSR